MARIYLSPPYSSGKERELLLDAFDSNWLAPLGPHVDAFERELAARAGVPHAAALSSGTAGLHLALIALGVGERDVVVTSSFTFAATANVIRYVGAIPVFVDSSPSSWTMDPELLDEELADLARRGTPAKAVISVDLYGQCCDYDKLEEICARHGVHLVEDAAEALGATYRGRPAGSFGKAAAFSFNGNKIVTTSGGGMLVSHDGALITRARHLATQAREPAPHYEHRDIGYNYRLSNLLAALGRGQLMTLDERVGHRREVNRRYRAALEGLPGITFMPEASYGTCSFWLTCVVIDEKVFGTDREAIRLALERQDIEARPAWKPMHLQPVFAACRMRGGAFCERIFEHGLCLPSGSQLSAGDQARVIETFVGQRC